MQFAKVYALLKPWYWWPYMRSTTKEFLKNFATCLLTKAQKAMAHGHWRARVATQPRTSWGFDFKGMSESSSGMNQLCVCIDLSTHFLILWAQPDRTAATTQQQLLDRLFNVHGRPLKFLSDDAAELLGKTITKLLQGYGITQCSTLAYHPEGNATAERVMRFLNAAMRSLTDEQYARWPDFISSMQAAWNAHVVRTIECSPFEAAHGMPMRLPMLADSAEVGDFEPATMSIDDVAVLRRSATQFYKTAIATAKWYQRRSEEKLNAVGTKRSFKVGDTVAIYLPPTAEEAKRRGRKVKHLLQYCGPCKVIERLSASTYKVQYVGDNPRHTQRKIGDAPALGKVYSRSIMNIAPFVEGIPLVDALEDELGDPAAPPPPGPPPLALNKIKRKDEPIFGSPADTSVYAVGDVIAVLCDKRSDTYWIQQVCEVEHEALLTVIMTTSSPDLMKAVFKKVYIHDGDQRSYRPKRGVPANQQLWKDRIPVEDLPALVLARGLLISPATGRLFNKSAKALKTELPGTTTHAKMHDM